MRGNAAAHSNVFQQGHRPRWPRPSTLHSVHGGGVSSPEPLRCRCSVHAAPVQRIGIDPEVWPALVLVRAWLESKAEAMAKPRISSFSGFSMVLMSHLARAQGGGNGHPAQAHLQKMAHNARRGVPHYRLPRKLTLGFPHLGDAGTSLSLDTGTRSSRVGRSRCVRRLIGKRYEAVLVQGSHSRWPR